nr:hypothetical protein [Tanacetum cinerariifolium]
YVRVCASNRASHGLCSGFSFFFETNNLADLVRFADAFGSPRLSNAGILSVTVRLYGNIWWNLEYDHGKEFKINVKQQNDSVDGATDSSTSLGSHFHSYMQTYQAGPIFQPPYQGYPFPGMVVPPYYQGNLPWPPNMKESKHRGKLSHMKGSQNDNFDSSDSSSKNDSGSDVRTSSRKVVIRNIDYINPISDGGNLRSTDDVSPVIQRSNTFKEELVSHKFEEPDIIPSVTRPKYKERDIFEDNFKFSERTKDVLVDEPLAVQAPSLSVLSDSQLRTQDETMEAWNPNMESESSYQKIVKLDFVADDKSTISRTKTLVSKGLDRKELRSTDMTITRWDVIRVTILAFLEVLRCSLRQDVKDVGLMAGLNFARIINGLAFVFISYLAGTRHVVIRNGREGLVLQGFCLVGYRVSLDSFTLCYFFLFCSALLCIGSPSCTISGYGLADGFLSSYSGGVSLMQFILVFEIFGLTLLQVFGSVIEPLTLILILILMAGKAWFYKGFDQLVIGLTWNLSLSVISSYFVVPCSALVLLLAPFLDIGFWKCNRTFNIDTDTDTDGNIIKKMFSIVDSEKFIFIICKLGGQFYVFAKGVWNHFKTVSILIGHRCDDFEYMVLLEDI